MRNQDAASRPIPSPPAMSGSALDTTWSLSSEKDTATTTPASPTRGLTSIEPPRRIDSGRDLPRRGRVCLRQAFLIAVSTGKLDAEVNETVKGPPNWSGQELRLQIRPSASRTLDGHSPGDTP